MTKIYELSNERMIMADVDEEHHTATVSVYALDNLVKEANKADVLEKIRTEIYQLHCHPKLDFIKTDEVVDMALDIIDNYREEQTDAT